VLTCCEQFGVSLDVAISEWFNGKYAGVLKLITIKKGLFISQNVLGLKMTLTTLLIVAWH